MNGYRAGASGFDRHGLYNIDHQADTVLSSGHLPLAGDCLRVTAMTSDESLICLTISSELRLLPLVRRLVEEAARLVPLPDDRRFEIVLAVQEACANVILHGHQQRRELPVVIRCLPRPDGLEVSLRDQARPLDFASLPEPDPTEMRKGGRGVVLIRRLVNAVSCEHPAEGGNLLRLFKRRDG